MPAVTNNALAIRAKQVLGTSVVDATGDKIGHIEDVVLNKGSNSILFAVVGFGGFLGLNEKYHPIPWGSLDYDPAGDAYIVSFTKEQLEAAPIGSIDELTGDERTTFRERTYDYYNVPRYWE